MIERAQEILKKEMEALESFPITNAFEQCVKLFLSCDGKVITTGVGKAGLVARKIAATLSSTGTPSFYMDTTDAVHGDLGMISDKDIILVLSNSGKTQEVLLTLNLCKNTFSCPIIGITSSAASEIAEYCDIILETGVIKEAGCFGLTPTSSTTVMSVIGDILATLTAEERGFTLEEYGKLHHSGYIGSVIRGK